MYGVNETDQRNVYDYSISVKKGLNLSMALALLPSIHRNIQEKKPKQYDNSPYLSKQGDSAMIIQTKVIVYSRARAVKFDITCFSITYLDLKFKIFLFVTHHAKRDLMGVAKSMTSVSLRSPRRLITVETFRYWQIFCVLCDNSTSLNFHVETIESYRPFLASSPFI